jgi:hypothetical protein
VELDEPVGGEDRLVELAVFVVGENLHQLAFGRPHRVGVLAFDLAKGLGGVGIMLGDQRIHRVVVQVVDRLFDKGLVLVGAAAPGHGCEQQHGTEPRQKCRKANYRFRLHADHPTRGL